MPMSGTKVRSRTAGTESPMRTNAPTILIRNTDVMYPLYRIFQSMNPVTVDAGVRTAPKAAERYPPTSKSRTPVARYRSNDATEQGDGAGGKGRSCGG